MSVGVLAQSTIVGRVFSFLPDLAAAALLLLLGLVLGVGAWRGVRAVVREIGLDDALSGTPFESTLDELDEPIANTLGALAGVYVFLLGGAAAAELLNLSLLQEHFGFVTRNIPSILAGVVVLLVGILLAEFAANAARSSATADATGLGPVLADGTRVLVYLLAIGIGLDTMGVSVGLLYTVVDSLVLAVAIAVALAVGIGVGLGSTDHVDEWLSGLGEDDPSAATDDD